MTPIPQVDNSFMMAFIDAVWIMLSDECARSFVDWDLTRCPYSLMNNFDETERDRRTAWFDSIYDSVRQIRKPQRRIK